MTNTTKDQRNQRAAVLRRRATGAGLGILLGTFTMVGITTALPSVAPEVAGGDMFATVPAVPSGSTAAMQQPARQTAPAVQAPRRVRTRQS